MSKIKTKELIICVVTLTILVLSIVTDVFATESSIFNELMGNNSKVSEIQDRGENNIQNKKNNVVNNTNNTNNTNKEAKMPNAGVDYSVLGIVLVCGISAIYAYKKINDYKNF